MLTQLLNLERAKKINRLSKANRCKDLFMNFLLS